MELKCRKDGLLWIVFEVTTLLLLSPFLHTSSLLISVFIPTNQCNLTKRIFRFVMIFPAAVVLVKFLLPYFMFGMILWLFAVSTSSPQRNWNSISLGRQSRIAAEKISVGTMNVLLGLEPFCRWQNISGVYKRLINLYRAIDGQGEYVENIRGTGPDGDLHTLSKEETVHANLHQMDVICFQEVHDRVFALLLVLLLRHRYSSFLLDIGENSWTVNRFLLGSGHLVASRYPVLDAKFFPFTQKLTWQQAVSYGALVIKLDLGNKRIGILTNLHTVAFQGKKDLIGPALDETMEAIHKFKEENVMKNEILVFDCIAGDFNADNMSPSDVEYNKHQIFEQYHDVCMRKPGIDHRFCIGTELRQLKIGTPEASNPQKFRLILKNDRLRYLYVLDADVKEHSMELMVVPSRIGEEDSDSDAGGMRRIDRILVDENLVTIRGISFSSALTGLTDHIPVVMTFAFKR